MRFCKVLLSLICFTMFCEPSNTTAKQLKNKTRTSSDPVPAGFGENSVRLSTFGVRLVEFGEARFFICFYYIKFLISNKDFGK